MRLFTLGGEMLVLPLLKILWISLCGPIILLSDGSHVSV